MLVSSSIIPLFVAKPGGNKLWRKFFTLGSDAKMRQIETIKPFSLTITGCVSPGSLLSRSQRLERDKRLDFVVSSGSGPEQSERSI